MIGITRNRYIFFTVAVVLLVGIAYWFGSNNSSILAGGCESSYKFINPEPDCETFESSTERMALLQSQLEETIAEFEQDPTMDQIGVFTRDLKTRRFAGVNDNRTFFMASLLKVPLAVAYFKYAEVEPGILNQKILYTGQPDFYSQQRIQPLEILKAGETYNIEEFLRRALVYSDNTAAEILARNAQKNFLSGVMGALSLQFEQPTGDEEFLVSPKTYANVFRILYNSSYLTREYSDKLLSILAGTEYKSGARASLPPSVRMANKFGERTMYRENGSVIFHQLHDCGIVYEKDNTYTFCIMTQGRNLERLEKAVQDISLVIYQGMN